VEVEQGSGEQADRNDADQLHLQEMPANTAAGIHMPASCVLVAIDG